MIRKVLHSFIILFLLAGIASAGDWEFETVGGPFESDAPLLAATNHPPSPTPLKSVTDTLSSYIVGQVATHQIGFEFPSFDHHDEGLSKVRTIAITFPRGFAIGHISSVTIVTTDSGEVVPEIKKVFAFYHTVVISLEKNLPSLDSGAFVYITLDGITNPDASGDYSIRVRLLNKLWLTVAGPGESEPFTITHGPAATLTIVPADDTTLRAGEGIAFTANITDQFGNIIESAQAQWMLDPTMDSIGTLFGSFFQATTVGVGRVIARADTLEAFSGLITVLPGDAAAIIVTSGADPVTIGQPLPYDVNIEIQDRFGNRKNDYLGAVWFTSDDPLAEIVHNETNPYQFTAADAGRAVFSGEQFVFGTAGARILTATDGTLSGYTHVYVLPGGGPANFDVSVPAAALAGKPFDITVTNAVDSAGDPYNGIILTLGGNVAPDGTEPIVPEIEIVNGQGIGHATLYGAGRNSLVFYSGSSAVEKIIIVSTGSSLASLELNIDRTQFLGNPFRGEARIQVFDEFGNPQTNFNRMGVDIRLTSSTGVVVPDIVTFDQFDQTGTADLSTYHYDGRPGLVTITANFVIVYPAIETTADMVVNGIYAVVDGHSGLPDWMPGGWTFDLRGESWNPADLTPKQIEYSAEFVGGDSPVPEINTTTGCIPQAGMTQSCRFLVHQVAGATPGDYEYRLRISALYDVAGEEITAVWTYSKSVEIRSFVPITLISDQLPSVVVPGHYSLPAELSIIDENNYDVDAKAAVMLQISKDSAHYTLTYNTFSFSWNSETPVNLQALFNAQMETGLYNYGVNLVVSIYGPDQKYRVDYTNFYSLDKTLNIIPRSELAVDTLSITPDRVPVGASIGFAFDLDLTGTTDIVLYGKQSTLTVTDGIVSATVFLRDSLYTLTSGANPLTADNMVIPGSWEGKHLTAQLHAVGIEDDVAPVDETIDFPFPVTVEASAAAVQALSLVNSAPNAPFVNIGQQFIMNAAIVNLSDADLDGPLVITLRSDGQSTVPPPVTVPKISARDTLKIVFAVTAAASVSPAEVFSFQISPPQSVDVLPPVDDNTVAVIQTPARLELTAEIPGKVPLTAVLAYGEAFDIVASAVNRGQAAISGGQLVLKYTGPGEFGIEFPSAIPLDSEVTWSLTAPVTDINSAFTIAWQEIPIDRNTGDAAIITIDSVALPFTVRAAETRLAIQASGFTTRPLMRGQSSKLFDLGLENITNDSRNAVALKSIMMKFLDRQGNDILPREIMSDSGANFFVNGKPVARVEYPVTIPEEPQVAVMFVFDSILIQPGGTLNMEFRLTPLGKTERNYFNIRITGDMIIGRIAEGPQAGETVPVTGTLDRAFEVNIPQSIIPPEFAASFKNYPNPFNPNREQTEIRYNLPVESDVDIYIYTATGERVRHLHFDAGSPGGQAGINEAIFWDGANGDGRTVLNGVYIAYIEVAASNLTATLKMAVVK